MHSVMGLVDTMKQAHQVATDFEDAGFARGAISVLGPDDGVTIGGTHVRDTGSADAAVAGATSAGAFGGALGLLAGLGALTIPGLGPFVAVGPILVAFAGAATGVALGGLAGALVGMGVPEHHATRYEDGVRSGGILMSVHADGAAEQERAKAIFTRNGGRDLVAVK